MASIPHGGCGYGVGRWVVVAVLMVMAVVSGNQDDVCGTRFTDVASSALLAPVVVECEVQRLQPVTSPVTSPLTSPLVPLTLYQAAVRVHEVHKGRELMEHSAVNSPLNEVIVEGLGEVEDRDQCVGHVMTGHSYVLFLRPQSVLTQAPDTSPFSLASSAPSAPLFTPRPLSPSESPSESGADVVASAMRNKSSAAAPHFVITALPRHLDPQTLRTVKKVLCPGCSTVPIIKHVKCSKCATPPISKRPMSVKDTKTVRAGKRLSLRCAAKGIPSPTYSWLKDGRLVHHSSEGKQDREGRSPNVFRSGSLTVRYTNKFSVLVVSQVTAGDAGTYTCLAVNPMGEVAQRVQVKVKGRQVTSTPSPPPPSPTDGDLDPCTEGSCDVTPLSSPLPPDTEEADPCVPNPCYNGGSCFTDHSGLGRCQCPPQYHGNTCQFRRRSIVQQEGRDVINRHDDDDDNTGLLPTAGNDQFASLSGLTASDNIGGSGNISGSDNISASDNIGGSGNISGRDNISNSDNISGGGNISDSDNISGSGNNSSRDKHVSDSDNNSGSENTPNANSLPGSVSRGDHSSRSSALRPGRRLSKKLSRKHRLSSSSSKTSKKGAPKLQVSPCPEEGYCHNGGTCKLVVLLQRRFCQCTAGFVGRRCERQL
ncbi:uncharacterized protein LOC143281137 [Babylonia areolata]|uniref:uncharacterized protein LOC143281137 n=1 Tax=Babylonia areolata TaxID=304850 RepID=UPI003FD46DBA